MPYVEETSILAKLFSLSNEVAVVTGVLGWLGPVWSYALLEAGASLLALDHPSATVSQPFQDLKDRFGSDRIMLLKADVKDRGALEEACKECIKKLGTPSILVNNAGIDQPPQASGKSYKVEEIPFEVNQKILEVNTLGMFQVTQVFGKEMVAARRGSIINIGSLYATVSPDAKFYDHIESDPPFLKPPAYGASKAAVINLTKYLAALWAPYGVRVNALSPGGILGGQDEKFKQKFSARVPLGRMGATQDLLGPLLFLASQASSYITGFELKVDGGFTIW